MSYEDKKNDLSRVINRPDPQDEDRPTSAQLRNELKRQLRKQRHSKVFRNIVLVVIVLAVAVFFASALFLPVIQISGSSMAPSLNEGDIAISIKDNDYERGCVYSFYYQDGILVKRAVALAGDTVDIDEDGTLYINGEALDEPYLEQGAKAYGTVTAEFPCQVPEGQIFMIGDNRSTSIDSRTSEIGCVPKDDIIGKVVFRLWPLNKIGPVK